MSEQKTSLLVVDDELSVRGLMTQIFRSSGYDVRCAENGQAALRLIRESTPAIVLSDLNMPIMSGWELLEVIRLRLPHIYVVAMSGSYSGSCIPDGVAANAFYEKGTSLPHLIQLVANGVVHQGAVRRTALVRG